jgi:hypothetical protein
MASGQIARGCRQTAGVTTDAPPVSTPDDDEDVVVLSWW